MIKNLSGTGSFVQWTVCDLLFDRKIKIRLSLTNPKNMCPGALDAKHMPLANGISNI
jgi:hypothetical protein